MGADVSDAQYCHNKLSNMLLLAYIITGEYAVRYITSLFQKVILLRNMLLSVSLVVNVILLRYVMRYISNVSHCEVT